MRNKIIVFCLTSMFLLTTSLSLPVLGIKTNIGNNDTDKWTWIFYDDADFYNAYDPFIDSYPDMPSFSEEAYSSENLNVIVLQDKEYDIAKLWHLDENHNKILLEEMGELNMGDYQTLKDLISYSKNHYPAERYLVSMYNHGGGWMGACWDNTNNSDYLTMDEMQKAFTETGGIDVLCFTAPCLMGAIESVYELRDCVDVYIGSEETSGYGHWWGTISQICNMLDKNFSFSNIEIGEQIIQYIKNNTPWPDSVTMSAIRTDKIFELVDTIDILSESLIENKKDSYKKFWSVHDEIQYFMDGGLLDLYDFAEKFKSIEANQTICQYLDNVMQCVTEAVIDEFHDDVDHKNSHGLTIYFPTKQRKYDSNYDNTLYGLDFSQDTSWDEFLQNYMRSVHNSVSLFFNDFLTRVLDNHPYMFPILRVLIGRYTKY